jgi:hypothetical protein
VEVSLRLGVNVKHLGDFFVVDHSIWSIRIPTRISGQHYASHHLLTNPGSYVSYSSDDPILVLLRAQGCLTFPKKSKYSSKEYLEIFNAATLSWYYDYYSHSLWNRLRSGCASKEELIAWILHNYHVSLNAGITHARIADSDKDLSASHYRCALEEYWHADSFYFVSYEGLSPDEVKNYLPLPSSYAFQIHLRQLARNQPNAYKLVSYFQERTIIFSDNAESFYDQVEAAYNMPGLFHGWRAHLQIDKSLNHYNERENILLADEPVDSSDLIAEIFQARIAFELLLCCLDDVEAERSRGCDYSWRIAFGDKRSLESTSVSERAAFWALTFFQGPHQLSDRIRDLLHCRSHNIYWIKCMLEPSCFTCLSYARSHDDVILLGKIAEHFSTRLTEENSYQPTLQELSFVNHLREVSMSDRHEFLVCMLVFLCFESDPGSSAQALRLRIHSKLSTQDLPQIGLNIFQCLELLDSEVLNRRIHPQDFNVA